MGGNGRRFTSFSSVFLKTFLFLGGWGVLCMFDLRVSGFQDDKTRIF